MPNKYRAIRTNGYASRKEARRAFELNLLERAGEISDLHQQVRFELIPKESGERPLYYVSDFTYMRDGILIVEDVKGFKTPVYKLKKRLMKYLLRIEITET